MRLDRLVLVLLTAPLAGCYQHGELGNIDFELAIADVLYEFESGDRVLVGTHMCPEIVDAIDSEGVHVHFLYDQALDCFDESVSGPAQFDADRCWTLDTQGEVLWELIPSNGCVAGPFLEDRIRIAVAEPIGQLRLGFDDWRVRSPLAVDEPPATVVGLQDGRSLDDLREDPGAERRVFAGQLDTPMFRLDDDVGRLHFADADLALELGAGATAVEPEEAPDPQTSASEWRNWGERPLILEPDAVATVHATLPGGVMLESPELIAVSPTEASSLDLVVMLEEDGAPVYAYAEVRDDQDRVLHAAPIEWSVAEGAIGLVPGGLDNEVRTEDYAILGGDCLPPSETDPIERHAVLVARLGALEDSVDLTWIEPPREPDSFDEPFEPDEACLFGDDLGGNDEVGEAGDDPGIDDGGCACSSDTHQPSRGSAWLMFAALMFGRRRRSRD